MSISDRSKAPVARTPRHVGWIKATFAGCAIAGPVYAPFVLGVPNTGATALLWPVVWSFMSLFVACFAVAIGIIPIALFVCAGWWLGRKTVIGRHPVLWAAVGTVIGFVLIPSIVVYFLPQQRPIGGAMTGFAIGLAAWRFVAWED